MKRRSLHSQGRRGKRKNIQTSAGARRSGRRRRSFTVENNWLRRRVLEKKNPGRQKPCWGSLFCTNLTQPTGALDSKASRLLLETMSEINKKMQATILMVTHDPFSASFCERILFLKDGKIFNEIFRGEKSRKDFFNEILDILTLLGGEVGNVR